MRPILQFFSIFAGLIIMATAAPAVPAGISPSTKTTTWLAARSQDNEAICISKNPALTNAIFKFCLGPYKGEGGFYEPSGWAHNGVMSDAVYDNNPHPWGVKVYNWCAANPFEKLPQRTWVTKAECKERLWDMCAKGGNRGENQRDYERCWRWIIPKMNANGVGLDWSPSTSVNG